MTTEFTSVVSSTHCGCTGSDDSAGVSGMQLFCFFSRKSNEPHKFHDSACLSLRRLCSPHPAIKVYLRTSIPGRPNVWTSGRLDAGTSGRLDFRTSRGPDVPTSEGPDVQTSPSRTCHGVRNMCRTGLFNELSWKLSRSRGQQRCVETNRNLSIYFADVTSSQSLEDHVEGHLANLGKLGRIHAALVKKYVLVVT